MEEDKLTGFIFVSKNKKRKKPLSITTSTNLAALPASDLTLRSMMINWNSIDQGKTSPPHRMEIRGERTTASSNTQKVSCSTMSGAQSQEDPNQMCDHLLAEHNDFYKVHVPRAKKRKQKAAADQRSPAPLKDDYELVTRNMEKDMEKIRSTGFLSVVITLLEPFFSAVVQASDNPSSPTSSSIDSIVCYGLGPFFSSAKARTQLSLLILLKESLQERSGSQTLRLTISDPVFSAPEIAFLQQLGWLVLTESDDCLFKADRPTLMFMPHCEIHMYSNLVECNHREKSLPFLFIFGNRLLQYNDRLVSKSQREKFGTFLNIINRSMTQRELIECYGPLPEAFNDTALCQFA